MCNTQKFFVIEPTQRGWRTSKSGVLSFIFRSGISDRMFYVFLTSSLHSTFPLRQQIAPTYWSITNITMEWYWMWFAHFHSERSS